ncbi:esterase [Streptacidiphilus sp. 4-A2]|nr:esterase [Streptacidiphilus sp. 4-A2]
MTVALAFTLALATLLLWNRIPGPRAVRAVGRILLLVSGQLAATAAILVWINIASGGLIVTWQDLLGNESTRGGVFAGQPGAVSLIGNTVPKVALLGTASVRGRFRPAADGFRVTTLAGRASGITARVYIWTPPQYTADPRRQFPVLELLHGVWGSPQGWMGPMNVVAHLEAAERSRSVHPFILVVPQVTPVPGHATPQDNEECSDIPGDARVGSWLTKDVRSMVVDSFRAEPQASGWGLMGYSTGGFCAAKLVLQYPGLYRAAVSLSGYYTPDSIELTDDPPLARLNNPLWLIGHTRTPAVSLLMTASDQDRVDPASEPAQMIAAALANPRARATEVQSFTAPLGGGHNQSAWEKMLPTAFTWLSQRLTGPT